MIVWGVHSSKLDGPGNLGRLLAHAKRIKAHPAYIVALGNLLGIEGPEVTTDLTTSKPTISGAAQTAVVVELDFDKSISDRVNIYSKRGTEADFTFLARDTVPPYVDNHPLLAAGKPELREHKCVYVQSDAEIGLFADDVGINCAPRTSATKSPSTARRSFSGKVREPPWD